MCDVHKTERAVHGPFSARLWSVQYPFQARFRAVLLKRSGVKRTVHGRFFWRILYVQRKMRESSSSISMCVYRVAHLVEHLHRKQYVICLNHT